ncbi:MAG: hypothetical protein WBW62_01300 [Solirubrobacterales bacterium]
MSDHMETPEEIQEELKELGIDNDATGKPDLFISGQMLKVVSAVLIVVLVIGALYLVF